MAAAVRLIIEKGLNQTRVVDVGRALGVPHSLFYWYFRDFEDLVCQAMVTARRTLRDHMGTTLAGVHSPLAKLYLIARESTRLGMTDEIVRVFTTEVEAAVCESYATEMGKTIDTFNAELVAIIAEAQREGVVRADCAAEHLAYCMRALIHYNVALYHRGALSGDIDDIVDVVASVAVRGLCERVDDALGLETRTTATAAADVNLRMTGRRQTALHMAR